MMPDNNLEVLQALSQKSFGLDLNGGLRLATGIPKDINGISQQLYGRDFNGTDPTGLISIFDRFKTLLGGRHLNLPGGAGNFVSTPDAIALDLAADVTVECGYRSSSYTFLHSLISKFITGTNNRSYRLRGLGSGLLDFTYSTAGTAGVSRAQTLNPIVEAGFTEVHIRVEFDAVDGANNTTRYYRSNSKAGIFTLLDTITAAGNVAIFNSTAPLEIGAVNNGAAEVFTGHFLYLNLYSGLPGAQTLVASPDFRFQAPGTTSFADSTGKTWTLNGTASIV